MTLGDPMFLELISDQGMTQEFNLQSYVGYLMNSHLSRLKPWTRQQYLVLKNMNKIIQAYPKLLTLIGYSEEKGRSLEKAGKVTTINWQR